MNLAIVSFAVAFVNMPFGYWRASVRKFSLQWFLAVHIPVPVIIVLRIFGGIGFAFYTYIFMISAFFIGQQIGAYSRKNKRSLLKRIKPFLTGNEEK